MNNSQKLILSAFFFFLIGSCAKEELVQNKKGLSNTLKAAQFAPTTTTIHSNNQHIVCAAPTLSYPRGRCLRANVSGITYPSYQISIYEAGTFSTTPVYQGSFSGNRIEFCPIFANLQEGKYRICIRGVCLDRPLVLSDEFCLDFIYNGRCHC
jgi:hypothetical protein